MEWFVKILVIALILILVQWIYNWVASHRKESKDGAPVRTESPVPVRGPEEEAATEKKIRPHPDDGEARKAPPPVAEGLSLEDGGVAYPVDFTHEAKRAEARFLHDPDNDVRIWVSGALPQDYLIYHGEASDGLAHGRGEAVLRVTPRDHTPNRVEGLFRHGIFMGNDPFPNGIIVLLNNDFLIELPSPRDDGTQFWIHQGFGPDSIRLGLSSRGYPPDLLVVAPSGLSGVEEDPIRELMELALSVYCRHCEPVREAWVRIVPQEHQRVAKDNRTEFRPVMAQAKVWDASDQGVKFYNYHNPEARAEEQRRKAQRREQARKREEASAPLRGRPDVRGVRLGMKPEEVWEALRHRVAEWEGTRETPGEEQRYIRPVLKVRFTDGATIKADFTSRVSGSQLFLLVFEQYYREGVKCKEIVRKLEQKYGKPDHEDQRWSGAYWATYGLLSTVKPPNRAFGPGGAFFKAHITPDRQTRFAEKLDIVLNDATLGDYDEEAIREDRKKATRRKFEESRSDKVEF